MKVWLTAHAQNMLQNRMNLSFKEARYLANAAWERGAKPSEFRSNDFRENFKSKELNHLDSTSSYRLYKGYLFVFSEDRYLITVYRYSYKPNKKYYSSRLCCA